MHSCIPATVSRLTFLTVRRLFTIGCLAIFGVKECLGRCFSLGCQLLVQAVGNIEVKSFILETKLLKQIEIPTQALATPSICVPFFFKSKKI